MPQAQLGQDNIVYVPTKQQANDLLDEYHGRPHQTAVPVRPHVPQSEARLNVDVQTTSGECQGKDNSQSYTNTLSHLYQLGNSNEEPLYPHCGLGVCAAEYCTPVWCSSLHGVVACM